MAPTIEQIGDYVSAEKTAEWVKTQIQQTETVAEAICALSDTTYSSHEIYDSLKDMGVCYIEKLPLKQVDAYEATEEHFDYVIFGLNPIEVPKEMKKSSAGELLSVRYWRDILGDAEIRVTCEEPFLDSKFIQDCSQAEVELIEELSPGESRRHYMKIYRKEPFHTYLEYNQYGANKIGFIVATKITPDSNLGQLIEDARELSESGLEDNLEDNRVLVEKNEAQWRFVEERDLSKATEVFRNLREEGYIPTLNFYIEMCGTGRMRIATPTIEGIQDNQPRGLIETGYYCVGEDFPGINKEQGSFKNPVLDNERMYLIEVSYPEEDNFEQKLIKQYYNPNDPNYQVFEGYMRQLANQIKRQKGQSGPMIRVAKLDPKESRRGIDKYS
jgi:hypothetical protein